MFYFVMDVAYGNANGLTKVDGMAIAVDSQQQQQQLSTAMAIHLP